VAAHVIRSAMKNIAMFLIADLVTYATTPLDYPQRCTLTKCFNIVTSASSYSTLPDDDDDHTPKHVGAVVILMKILILL
jgi:hypothetical protein